MKVLVIGQGGREHALVRALRLSPSVTEIHAIPGSDGIAAEALCHKLDWQDTEALLGFIRRTEISLVVVGPEVPLADGLADRLRENKVSVFGPSGEAAQLEASKIYSKQFMVAAGIPTARFFEVASVAETLKAAESFQPPFVLKADGLAAGKGVLIPKDRAGLERDARAMFEEKTLGEAGSRALLEEFQPGYEISYLVLTNGETYEALILAQDHKRLQDGDQGPNTGGMGVVAPLEIDASLRKTIETEILDRAMAEMKKRGLIYRGVLYVGLMITDKGPSVIEFNVRFGDPEAQVILPLLDGDWGLTLKAVAEGEVPRLKWKKMASACIVLAAPGYPDNPERGVKIEGRLEDETASSYFLHAGTKLNAEREWVTSGGRVLNAIGVGSDLREALQNGYEQARKACWPGIQLRSDIGHRLLK